MNFFIFISLEILENMCRIYFLILKLLWYHLKFEWPIEAIEPYLNFFE